MPSSISNKNSDHSQSKSCSRCKNAKPISEFYAWNDGRSGKQKISSRCRECECAARRKYVANNHEKVKARKREAYRKNPEYNKRTAREWREANPERFKQWGIEYRKRTKEQARKRHYEYRYGFSTEVYEAAVERQGGKCAICRSARSTTKRSLHVDHCHKTGKFRGILCSRCNSGIGNLRDDPKLLARAIAYLTIGVEKMNDIQ